MVVSIVIGALVFAYWQAFRHRDVQVRLSSDRAAARFLARGALDTLKGALREATDTKRLASPELENGTLIEFLLADAKSIEKRVKKKTDGKDDHRELIEQLVGKEALEPIDELVEKLPDAKVQMFLTIEPKPYASGASLADPVLKTVAIGYRVLGRVRKAQETFRAAEMLTVHSLLPNGVARFTFASVSEQPFFNTHRVYAGGDDAGGTAPVVLMHSPQDGDPMTDSPFDKRPDAQKAMTTKVGGPGDLMKVADDRGMTFLASAAERPALLQLASGATPFGEYHTVYQPQAGKVSKPAPQSVTEQPKKMPAFRVPYRPADATPDEPPTQLAPFVQGAVFGFSAGIDEEGMLGPPPQGAIPDGCSVLKPFGTGTHPSAGLVVGHVNRAMAGISDVGVDRDDTGKDEAEQAAVAGRPLPVRETRDPFLRNASGGEYASDAPRSGTTGFARLIPFQPAVNMNLAPDYDNDGRPDAVVSTEARHASLPLGDEPWKYSNLFEGYDEYARVMSKYVTFPANLSLFLGAQPLDRSRQALVDLAFGKPGGPPLADWTLERFALPHRDPLHDELKDKEPAMYIDTRKTGIDDLATVIGSGARGLYPGQRALLVKGQRKFEEVFMAGGRIDLQGLKVIVERENPDDPPGLQFDGEITIKPGSGGWLSCELFRAKAIKNGGQDAAFAPFVLEAQQLVMTGKGPYECVFVGGSIAQDKVNDYTVLRGSVATAGVRTELTNPLVIAYDPRSDPTSKVAHLYYRLAFNNGPRVYDLEDRP